MPVIQRSAISAQTAMDQLKSAGGFDGAVKLGEQALAALARTAPMRRSR